MLKSGRRIIFGKHAAIYRTYGSAKSRSAHNVPLSERVEVTLKQGGQKERGSVLHS